MRISFCTHYSLKHTKYSFKSSFVRKFSSNKDLYYLVIRAHEDAVGGVVVQVVPDHDGQGVGPGSRLLHLLQGTVTATIVFS